MPFKHWPTKQSDIQEKLSDNPDAGPSEQPGGRVRDLLIESVTSGKRFPEPGRAG